MSRRIIRMLPVAALAISQACVMPGKHGPTANYPRGSSSPGQSQTQSRGIPFSSKSVVGKQEPVRLFASDGTSCVVSKKKFLSTLVGASVSCGWAAVDR